MPDVDGLWLSRSIKDDLLFAEVKIILLTSMGQSIDSEEWRRSGVDACMVKPVKQTRLLKSIARLLTGEGDSGTSNEAKPVQAKSLRILVAEDNTVNQKVILLQLKKLGYSADAVANEAVEGVRKIPYDVVLMDCHMPEMNGYEATRAIRQMTGRAQLTQLAHGRQRRRGTPRVPRRGDGRLPDQADQSGKTEERDGRNRKRHRRGAGGRDSLDADAIVDGLKSFGDAAVIGELIDLFLGDAPGKIAQAQKAIDSVNAAETREAIHSLRAVCAQPARRSVGPCV